MSILKPHYVANLLVEWGSNPDSQKLDGQLVTLLSEKMAGLSAEEVGEWVEQHEGDVANELFQKESDSRNDAKDLNFNISTEDDGFYLRFFDTPGIKLLRQLQKGTASNFEQFCGNLLKLLGGTSNVEGGPYDGGIDFWASELMLNNLLIPSTAGSRILVVGQAKRHQTGNHVTEKDLREFVGASMRKIAELKRTRTEQFGALQPVILAFWTTSDFHRHAKGYAKELGIWYLGGPALCQMAVRLGIEDTDTSLSKYDASAARLSSEALENPTGSVDSPQDTD